MIKKCLNCKKEFEIIKSRNKTAKYCNKKCMHSCPLYLKNLKNKIIGRKITWKDKFTKTIQKQYDDGRKPWNYKLTKKTDERVKKAANNLKNLYKNNKVSCGFKLGNQNIAKRKDIRDKISNGIKKAFKEGRMNNSLENNANWLGGISFEPYGLEFNKELKNIIRKRDNFKCQICSKKRIIKKHAVHHIDYNKKNNDPKNLITLCNSCHTKTNFTRKKWTKYFQGGINGTK